MRMVKPERAARRGFAPLIAGLALAALLAPARASEEAQAFGPTAQGVLGRPIETGEAVVCYLYHSGWAVKTKGHLLIFDYTEPPGRSGRRALDDGSVEPAELDGRNVTVFVTHAHSDHFDPEILKWRDAVKAIRYVWGWEGVGEPEDIHFGRERRVVEDRGLEILNIYHEGDSTPESSFLVRVDGLTIFHAGDHGSSRGMNDPVFGGNILYLAGQAPRMDLMFTPTFGGEIEAIRAFQPRAVFPMHDGGRERQYARFAEKVRALGLDVEVGAAERPGARFLYAQGRLRATFPTERDRLAPETEAEALANTLQPPARVMDILGLATGMNIAEIGAGKGRYVVHLADRVGPEGQVYAEDIDAEALGHLAERCRLGGFANVEVILGDTTDPKLPRGVLDLIFIVGSYQHFSDPVALMRNARTALKKGGRAAIFDRFAARDTRYDVTEKTMFDQMEKAGFVLEHIDRSLEAGGGGNIYLFKQGAQR
jgi:L-ascorbate metabolism protein UlaG (beta-lactamase superfamily)/SAM-dependent methyltransferase